MELKLVLQILASGFALWNTKEGNKYRDDAIGYEKDYDEELDKRSSGQRYSQLKLDRIMRDSTTLAKNFVKYAPK